MIVPIKNITLKSISDDPLVGAAGASSEYVLL